jgi:rare lipoprotein A
VTRFTVSAILLSLALPLMAAEEGLASWYAGKFQGRTTASGEVFDTNKLTAAHKTLPFGTLVRVTNLENERSVVVRINDRGPFVEGRVIDLSRAAADAIGMSGAGLASVRVEVVGEPGADQKLFTIQIGAYGKSENAERAARALREGGLEPVLVPTRRGIIRVQIQNVASASIPMIREKAAGAGFAEVLVFEQE